LLIFIVAKMPVDLLMDVAALGLLGLAMIGALGWFVRAPKAIGALGGRV
jgi:hypothetical protein